MSDAAEALVRGIETQLSSVATGLHQLTTAQVETGVELREFKERLLKAVESLEDRVQRLEGENAAQRADIASLKSRQAPVSAPVAWIAVIISGLVAATQFFPKS